MRYKLFAVLLPCALALSADESPNDFGKNH